MAARKGKDSSIEILQVQQDELYFRIVGTSPFVCNAMSAKVRQELLLPSRKKKPAERAASLKHNPLDEYRRSPYRTKDEGSPTRIVFLGAGFKKSMAGAALEIPGATKAQIGRLCQVPDYTVPIYGVPQLWMSTVRSAGIDKTPDVRTRAVIPEWATLVGVRYVTPNLNAQGIANLVAAAGLFIGVGDGRPEKGALSFGTFEIVGDDDERWNRIVQSGGREAQDAALESPTFFDHETEALYDWWQAEVRRRGFEVA